MLESAQQFEQEGDLEEAVRYYEIAQDHLPTPSADLRVSLTSLSLPLFSLVTLLHLRVPLLLTSSLLLLSPHGHPSPLPLPLLISDQNYEFKVNF